MTYPPYEAYRTSAVGAGRSWVVTNHLGFLVPNTPAFPDTEAGELECRRLVQALKDARKAGRNEVQNTVRVALGFEEID